MKSIEAGFLSSGVLAQVYIEDLRAFLDIDFGGGLMGCNCVGMWCGDENPWGCFHSLYLHGEPLNEIVLPEDMTYLSRGPLMSTDFSVIHIPAGMEMIEPDALCAVDHEIWWYGDHPTFDLLRANGEDCAVTALHVPEGTEHLWVDASEVDDYQPQFEDDVDGWLGGEPYTFDPKEHPYPKMS